MVAGWGEAVLSIYPEANEYDWILRMHSSCGDFEFFRRPFFANYPHATQILRQEMETV